MFSKRCRLWDVLQRQLYFRDKGPINQEIHIYLIPRCKIWPALRWEADTLLCKFLILCQISIWVYMCGVILYVNQKEMHKYLWQLVWMNSQIFEEAQQDSAAHRVLLPDWWGLICPPVHPLPNSSITASHQITGHGLFWRSEVTWSWTNALCSRRKEWMK